MNSGHDTPGFDAPDLDEAVFGKLLVMAGPELADDLVGHFRRDLSSAKQRLLQGLAQQDWHMLRESSHVLIALAGTAGANRLQADAITFNAFANNHDLAGLQAMTDDLVDLTEALIAFITSHSASGSEPAS